MLLALFLSAFQPDLSRLGDDSYAVREWESKRCDNPLSVLMLPSRTDNPEVNDRIDRLKRKYTGPTQIQIERRVADNDYPRWVEQYFLLGRSNLSERDLFLYLVARRNSGLETWQPIFRRWPKRTCDNGTWDCPGPTLPWEFEQFKNYLDHNLGREKK